MYEVVVANPATSSENRIHSDEVARRHGFRGGLVPGVTVYGYMVREIVDVLGDRWIEHGSTNVRFRSPCYDGDLLTVMASGSDPVDLRASVGETVCVSGSARPGHFGYSTEIPDADPPPRAERPPASVQSLAPGTILGSIPLPTDLDTTVAYLSKVSDASSIYLDGGWIHPGMLLEGANWVLSANVVLPPWLHVESEVWHLRAVQIDEPVTVRGLVDREWEHKGHRFVTLRVSWMAGDSPVAGANHTAIWSIAPKGQ